MFRTTTTATTTSILKTKMQNTLFKGLNILIGLKVYKVKIYTKKLRYIIPKSIIKIQKDSKIINIQRIAKYILIHFSLF